MRYFRNKIELNGQEPERLWKLENGFFILVDDDEFVAVEASLHTNDFYEISKPCN